jgi:DNA-binding Xre family transcriptional regulator
MSARRAICGGADVDHWARVAQVAKDRMAELSMTQRELSEKSGLSTATLRKLSVDKPQRLSRSTLAGISRTLGLGEDHLWRVSRGESPTADSEGEVSALRAEVSELTRRVEALETRLATPNGR